MVVFLPSYRVWCLRWIIISFAGLTRSFLRWRCQYTLVHRWRARLRPPRDEPSGEESDWLTVTDSVSCQGAAGMQPVEQSSSAQNRPLLSITPPTRMDMNVRTQQTIYAQYDCFQHDHNCERVRKLCISISCGMISHIGKRHATRPPRIGLSSSLKSSTFSSFQLLSLAFHFLFLTQRWNDLQKHQAFHVVQSFWEWRP